MVPAPPANLCFISVACVHRGLAPFQIHLLSKVCRDLKKCLGMGMGSVLKK